MRATMRWLADSEVRLLYASAELLKWLGVQFRQITGHGWVDVVHPDDISEAMQILLRTFEARQILRLTLRLRNAEGKWRWMRALGWPRADGNYWGVVVEFYPEDQR